MPSRFEPVYENTTTYSDEMPCYTLVGFREINTERVFTLDETLDLIASWFEEIRKKNEAQP
jgi:hypothetical protein